MATTYVDLNGLEYFKGKQDAYNDGRFATKASVPTKVSQLTNDSGYQTSDQLQTAISNALASVLTWKGVKETVSALPGSGNKVGDVWHVSADSAEYAWDGSEWQALGGVIQASVAWDDITGKPSTFAPSAHTHTTAQVTGLDDALAGKAAATHSHDDRYYTESEVDEKLAGKAGTSHTHAAMGAATAESAGTAGFVPAPAAGKQASFLRGDGTWVVPTDTKYNVATDSADGLMSSEDKEKLDGIAEGANKYVHPSSAAGAKGSGLYKIATDANGHVTGATAVAKSDITALGIPGQDTTYSAATGSAAGLMSAADKTKLDGIGTVSTTDIDALFA